MLVQGQLQTSLRQGTRVRYCCAVRPPHWLACLKCNGCRLFSSLRCLPPVSCFLRSFVFNPLRGEALWGVGSVVGSPLLRQGMVRLSDAAVYKARAAGSFLQDHGTFSSVEKLVAEDPSSGSAWRATSVGLSHVGSVAMGTPVRQKEVLSARAAFGNKPCFWGLRLGLRRRLPPFPVLRHSLSEIPPRCEFC